MMTENNTPKGASTEFYYIWDEVYGWIHISETEKMIEARERFRSSCQKVIE